jgi:hypothetical protein
MERDMADLRRRLLAVEELCRDRDGCVVDGAAEESVPSASVTAATTAAGDEAGTADAMED